VHLVDGGLFLDALDLAPVASRAEWDDALAAYVTGRQVGWITGGGWDHERWGGWLPDRGWLDPLTGSRPALLLRSDLHIAVANSAALERAGIDRGAVTADPDGGQIVRNAEGRPTGVLRDTAIDLVASRVPAPTAAQLDAALHRAIRHAHRHGLTQVHDKGELPPSWRDLEVLERAEIEGRLDLRVSVATPIDEWEALAERVASRGRGSDLLRWGSVKGFFDGSLGAATARFHTPFLDLPDSLGLVVCDPEALAGDVRGAWDAGIQPIVHAIGDAAVDWLIDVYADLGPATADIPPPRIEHAQHLSPGAAERMATAGVVASMQPIHLVADAPWLERRIGPDRTSRAYPIRTLAEAGVPLAFGSDWTVAPLDPLAGIRAAVQRRSAEGDVFLPDERISPEAALRGYTVGAAAAAGFRHRTGWLAPGRAADFVVIEGIDPADPYVTLGGGRVVRTFVGGREVYRAENE